MKAESRQIPQKLAARLEFFTAGNRIFFKWEVTTNGLYGKSGRFEAVVLNVVQQEFLVAYRIN